MHQRAGQCQPLLETQRQFSGIHGQERLQGKYPHHIGYRCLLARTGQAVDAGEKLQVLRHAEVAVQGKFLRHIADLLPCLAGGFFQVQPHHPRLATADRQQAAHHLEGGGFARAIGAEQAEDFATADTEIHMIGGDKIAKTAGELFGHDDGVSIHAIRQSCWRHVFGKR
jgi:hypothetical protein